MSAAAPALRDRVPASDAGQSARVRFTGSGEALGVIAALGRTEDVTFSPDDRRLAIAGFAKNRIVVLEIAIVERGGMHVEIGATLEIASSSLHRPHGVCFIDDATLVVANRGKDAPVFVLPKELAGHRAIELAPVVTIRRDERDLLQWPGSVAASRLDDGAYELLICNNYAHHVTRHRLRMNGEARIEQSELLLQRNLKVPDGVAIDRDRRWIAVSNHDTHSVLLYENLPRLGRDSRADGELRALNYPHGVRFTPDGSHLLVADAGAPYVNVYARGEGSWNGVRRPVTTLRVMDEGTFLRGHFHPTEGGPKGIDLDDRMRVLVTTCAEQGLAFFDLRQVLARRGVSLDWRRKSLQWRYEWIRDELRRRRGWK